MTRDCSIEDCRKLQFCRGWCSMHYARWRRSGDPLTTARTPNGAHLTWLSEVASGEPTEDCIPYPFPSIDRKGYGRVHYEGKDRFATHVVLILSDRPRPAPPRDRALHSCDNPGCCNPRHLRWGTQADNLMEMSARGRSPRGERQPHHIVTAEQVADIRARDYSQRGSKKATAEEFHIAPSTLTSILNRTNWKHVEEEV